MDPLETLKIFEKKSPKAENDKNGASPLPVLQTQEQVSG